MIVSVEVPAARRRTILSDDEVAQAVSILSSGKSFELDERFDTRRRAQTVGWSLRSELGERACINRNDISAVTPREADGRYRLIITQSKNKSSVRRGRQAGVNSEQISRRNGEIFKMALAGETMDRIGQRFGITRQRVQQVLRTTGFASLADRGLVPPAKKSARERRALDRTDDLLLRIAMQPGVTTHALGKMMGVRGSSLYDLVADLETCGVIARQDRGWRIEPGAL